MSKTVAIHQPNFLPWIGYFHKIIHSDVFVLFDNVQFPRGKSYGNRVLIKANNSTNWLTVPVRSKSELPLFNEVTIDYQSNWSRKMLKTIMLNYKKAEHFDFFYEELLEVFEKKHDLLFELNKELILLCLRKMGVETRIIISSDISQDDMPGGDQKILDILEKTAATEYLSGKGAGSRRYIDESVFKQKNIKLIWQELKDGYQYRQQGNAFVPNLSIIDLIFNEGPNSANILKQI